MFKNNRSLSLFYFSHQWCTRSAILCSPRPHCSIYFLLDLSLQHHKSFRITNASLYTHRHRQKQAEEQEGL